MIKDLSTVGIALMTALVVYRASTIDHSIELDGIYQRPADVSFTAENNGRLQSMTQLQFGTELLVFNAKTPAIIKEHEGLKKFRPNPQVIWHEETRQLPTTEESTEIAVMEEDETHAFTIAEDFSLDRESTINSNLSLLFPRQRILQHPSVGELSR